MTNESHDEEQPESAGAPGEAHAAAESAAAMDKLRAHYQRIWPVEAEVLAGFAQTVITEAELVAKALDRALIASGAPPGVLVSISFNSPAALRFIDHGARTAMDDFEGGKSKKDAALLAGDFVTARLKMVLDEVRQALREGFSESDALAINADGIAEFSLDPRFAQALGELMRTHQRRGSAISVREAIRRAWLPLHLWQCGADGVDAFDRCSAGDRLLGLGIFSGGNESYPAFRKAWGKVRNELGAGVKG